ncbi:ETX/MTX2 family pore-forming toxin [Archangium lipolyticum]|uniref:ETX/MTX2 family pore-forming toxin n=1 Tax=Archangium lipolyticum TaxID=2970465 RepID=UPI002149FD96|nr:ETX/MTX2 family pore-forming toxin [Archangium lipolyticum]
MLNKSIFKLASAAPSASAKRNHISMTGHGLQAKPSSNLSASLQGGDTWQTNVYGGQGGVSFTWAFGESITKLVTYSIVTATSSSTAQLVLSGMQVTFDDGTSIAIGNTDSSQAPTTQTIDLTSDSIENMYILVVTDPIFAGDPKKQGVGALYFETLQGQTFSSAGSTYTPAAYSANWQLVSVNTNPCSNFYPVGLMGAAANAVDSLSFYFQNDSLVSRTVEEFDYSGLTPSTPTPINVASATATNGTGEAQEMSINFSESVTSTYSWTATAGIRIGAELTIKSGIPFIAEGEAKISTELSFDYTWGEDLEVSRSFGYEAAVTVPPSSAVQALATASSYTLSGSYTANLYENWAHAGSVKIPVQGTIQGVSAYDVDVAYNPVSGA